MGGISAGDTPATEAHLRHATNLTRAMSLGALGMHVFPVNVSWNEAKGKWDKVPLTTRGFYDGTTDHEQIALWWIDNPDAAIGVWCGASRVIVADLDQHGDDENGVAEVTLRGLELPETVTYNTISGNGQHHIYEAPDGMLSTAKLYPGVERLAGGKYFVWHGPVPTERNLPAAPEWLAQSGRDRTDSPYAQSVDEWMTEHREVRAPFGLGALPEPGAAYTHPAVVGMLAFAVRLGLAHRVDEIRDRYLTGQWATPEWAEEFEQMLGWVISEVGSAFREEHDAARLREIAFLEDLFAGRIEVPVFKWVVIPLDDAPDEAPVPDEYAIFANMGAILDGTVERQRATVGRRTDGQHLFYRAAHNQLIGDPESAKTLLALSVACDELFEGGKVLWVDMDHNSYEAITGLFREWGVPADVLRDRSRFLLIDPEDTVQLTAALDIGIRDGFTYAVIDSIGELLGLYGVSANEDEGYTPVNRAVMARLARAGMCVVSIDHFAKGVESRAFGGTGTIAKKRAIDGAQYEVVVLQEFAPGKGGRSKIKLRKDRKGDIRANTPADGRTPHVADFVLTPLADGNTWRFVPPHAVEAPKSDLELVKELSDEQRVTVRSVKDALGISTDRAGAALKQYRTMYP